MENPKSDFFQPITFAKTGKPLIPVSKIRHFADECKVYFATLYTFSVLYQYCSDGFVFIPELDPGMSTLKASFTNVIGGHSGANHAIAYPIDREKEITFDEGADIDLIAEFQKNKFQAAFIGECTRHNLENGHPLSPSQKELLAKLVCGKIKIPVNRYGPKSKSKALHRDTIIRGICISLSETYGINAGANRNVTERLALQGLKPLTGTLIVSICLRYFSKNVPSIESLQKLKDDQLLLREAVAAGVFRPGFIEFNDPTQTGLHTVISRKHHGEQMGAARTEVLSECGLTLN